jgi:hypothetical protein
LSTRRNSKRSRLTSQSPNRTVTFVIIVHRGRRSPPGAGHAASPELWVVRLAPENRPGAIDKRRFWFLVQQRPYFAELVMRTMADRPRRQTGQEAS